MNSIEVDHLNIVVTDLHRAVDFYTRALGLRETRRAHLQGEWIERIVGLEGVSAEVIYVEAGPGSPRIELLQYLSPCAVRLEACSLPNTPGLRHIAFRVDDIASAARRIEAAGGRVLGPPIKVPSSTISHDRGEKTLCYFHDPEGVLLELAEYREG